MEHFLADMGDQEPSQGPARERRHAADSHSIHSRYALHSSRSDQIRSRRWRQTTRYTGTFA